MTFSLYYMRYILQFSLSKIIKIQRLLHPWQFTHTHAIFDCALILHICYKSCVRCSFASSVYVCGGGGAVIRRIFARARFNIYYTRIWFFFIYIYRRCVHMYVFFTHNVLSHSLCICERAATKRARRRRRCAASVLCIQNFIFSMWMASTERWLALSTNLPLCVYAKKSITFHRNKKKNENYN